jgi:hypothetical protein
MGATVTSFTGLQNLTNIQQFRADYNSLTSIDLSGLSSLTLVDLSDNDLPGSGTNSPVSVNLSGCTSLETLYLDDNDLSAGFPDLSDCTSLSYMDFDQCGLVGSIDISNLPSLEYIDFSQNFGLTELIISRNQPLGDNGNEVTLNDCGFSQTVVDNILLELASGSVSNGYVGLENNNGGTNAAPGQIGRDSLFILDSRGWSFDVAPGNHTMLTVAYDALEANICGATNTDYLWMVSGSTLEVGNILYQNSDAWNPANDGWWRLDGDGSITIHVSGSGEIVALGSCGV